MVTVGGFADLAGSSAFNRCLGQRRAEAIHGYLTANGGRDNRRVALVIDYAGAGISASM